ncbi:MAG: cytochrome c peroxidase [Reichenbachiella sp.]|uniref:cytochrome-c peroxidase n=1 Tax=Reichenbachiella sp. TaxID=2184521 RepID=UPI002965FCC2|nr:cytochrome c peroxidase [Reichenbachiella sp.]MDW3211548.1 cytochrome c peroxidase [Reichenbachiella sp.]
MTQAGVALGKDLFFDPRLSANEQISCASCHQPDYAFGDRTKFSVGHSGITLKRNTPPLFNLTWSESFFWDGGVKNLESLSFAALMNPDEMGVDLTDLCQKLNTDKHYKEAFKTAFGIDSVTSAYISRALAQYMRTLVSANSKYDSVQLGLTQYNNEEQEGERVFLKNCASCHTPPLFTDFGFHHNGIDQVYSLDNLSLTTGRFRITRDSLDLGKYKTSSLRNLKYTAPYMHDGRFANLDEVLVHYQNQNTLNQNQDSLVSLIKFSDKEKEELKSFLMTLENPSFD